MNERYEYLSPVELGLGANNYFVVPASIICGTNMNEKRVAIFSYLSIRRGLDCSLMFTVNNIVKWMNKQPNRNANGINNKIIKTIEDLRDDDYIEYADDLNHSSCVEAYLNMSKISYECENSRFAVIYIDELKQIINYQNLNCTDTSLSNDVLLLVFSYLRMKIYRRRNKLLPEEINIDNKNNHQHDITTRRLRSPDAFDCYYNDIASALDISSKAVSKAIAILNELNLIYSEQLPRVKHNGKWHTDHTIFCNAYKREGSYLLTSGEDYYLNEIINKKRRLNVMIV